MTLAIRYRREAELAEEVALHISLATDRDECRAQARALRALADQLETRAPDLGRPGCGPAAVGPLTRPEARALDAGPGRTPDAGG